MKHKPVKWIKALRSGKYEQASEALCTTFSNGSNPQYCCLGVRAKLAGVSNKQLSSVWYGVLAEEYCKKWEVPKHLGLKEQDGGFNSKLVKWPSSISKTSDLRLRGSLAQLNDYGATFDQIADFIELNWRVL